MILIRGFDSMVIGDSSGGGQARRVAVRTGAGGSLGPVYRAPSRPSTKAVTTSSRFEPIAVRAARATQPAGRLGGVHGRPVGLAGEDEDPAQADAPGTGDVGFEVVADHRDVGRAEPRTTGGPDLGRELAKRLPEHDRRGLAGHGRPPLQGVLQADHEGAGVEGDRPWASSTTGCGASR